MNIRVVDENAAMQISSTTIFLEQTLKSLK